MEYINYRSALSSVIVPLAFLALVAMVLSAGNVNAVTVQEASDDTEEGDISELEISNEEHDESIEGTKEETAQDVADLRRDNATDVEATPESARPTSARDGSEAEESAQIGEDEGDIIIEDDDDSIEPAQDYNSTRSNRRKNSFFNPEDGVDSDDDGDGIITVHERNILEVRQGGPSWRCSVEAATDSEGEVYCWGQGVRAVATGDEDSDGAVNTGTRVLNYLQVRANDVRSWSAEDKEALRSFRESEGGKNTPERAAAVITEKVLDNEKIEEMEVSEKGVRMRYRAEMKLFGLFSITREVDASISENGDVDIDLPWYSFISRKPDNSNIREVLMDTMDILVLVPGRAGK